MSTQITLKLQLSPFPPCDVPTSTGALTEAPVSLSPSPAPRLPSCLLQLPLSISSLPAHSHTHQLRPGHLCPGLLPRSVHS